MKPLKTCTSAYISGLLALSLFVACASVPETRYYMLGRIAPQGSGSAQQVNLTVGVPQFEAEGIYARDNMLYRKSPYEIAPDYYRRWGVPPQRMLSEVTVDYLRRSGLFAEVLRMPTLSRVDLVLNGRIIRFEEETGPQGPAVRVDLEFSLEKSRTNERLWWDEVSSSSPISLPQTAEASVSAAETGVRTCLEKALGSLAEFSAKLSSTTK